MKKLLGLFLLALAPSLFAQDADRVLYPDDYKPSPCAPDAKVTCQAFPQSRASEFAATFRGFNLHQEWADAHWDEMMQAFLPLCRKISNCFTTVDNDWVFCTDIMKDEFLAACDKFEKGSDDHTQCVMFAMTYYVGLGAKTKVDAQAKACVKALPPAPEKTMTAWMKPAKLKVDHDGRIWVTAYDADTHIPVRALLTIDGGGKLQSTDNPDPTTGYPAIYRLRLKRVPNAEGHRDVVAPTATLKATGYKPYTFTLPVDVPRMTVEMSPCPDQLKVGQNTITITARDAETGKPVRARVMAEDMVLGDTNVPLELTLTPKDKRPEIWVTSLYDRYNDVVVAKRGE
ncbi:MAG: hypothetical protein M3Q69_06075 [Acidobacteriota bacterium]|nr:hypothetical protein [Acidobacteriota bacterium]